MSCRGKGLLFLVFLLTSVVEFSKDQIFLSSSKELCVVLDAVSRNTSRCDSGIAISIEIFDFWIFVTQLEIVLAGLRLVMALFVPVAIFVR